MTILCWQGVRGKRTSILLVETHLFEEQLAIATKILKCAIQPSSSTPGTLVQVFKDIYTYRNVL